MDEHFIILGLPRSMTAWVSCFLTCGEVFCQHELAEKMPIEDIIDEIRSPIFPVSGICDSGLLMYHEWLKKEFPKAKFVWIDRPQEDAEFSFMLATGTSRAQMGITFESWKIERENFLSTNPEVFTFDELQTEDGARRLWNYCAPHHPLPPAHLRKMMSLKVTVHPKVYGEAAKILNKMTDAEIAYAGMRALTG